jgi:predicted phosphodiesterase
MKKLILLAILILFPLQAFAFKAGIISDIHAGKLSKRKSGSSIVYPRKAVQYFERAVKEMKLKGVELIIVLGDNTHNGGKKYYKQLRKIENKYGIKTLWVHGNHSYKDDDYLAPRNYTYDKEGIRFIILDTSVCPKEQKNAGCLDQSQVDFLHFNQTGNDVILQHIPPLIPNTCEMRTDFIAEEGFRVFAGHFHKDKTCGNIRVFPPLTEHKRLEYRIVEF